MNVKNIRAALAQQAKLLGIVPTLVADSANVTVKTQDKKPEETVGTGANSDIDTLTPITITANTSSVQSSLLATSDFSSITPTENSVTLQAETVTPSASVVTVNNSTDSTILPVSIAATNQLSLTSEEKPARKTKKKETVPTVPKPEPIEVIVAKHLKAGRDYDRLPNTSKPTLLKSGAEILAGIFGFRTTAQVINRIEDYEKSFVLYEVQVTVWNSDNKIVAEGIGSCNSRERKFLKGDFATQLNTILKMSKKRAYVDAILTACHASKVFTQDVEDIAAGITD